MNFVKILINATKETCNEYINKKKSNIVPFALLLFFEMLTILWIARLHIYA